MTTSEKRLTRDELQAESAYLEECLANDPYPHMLWSRAIASLSKVFTHLAALESDVPTDGRCTSRNPKNLVRCDLDTGHQGRHLIYRDRIGGDILDHWDGTAPFEPADGGSWDSSDELRPVWQRYKQRFQLARFEWEGSKPVEYPWPDGVAFYGDIVRLLDRAHDAGAAESARAYADGWMKAWGACQRIIAGVKDVEEIWEAVVSLTPPKPDASTSKEPRS